MPRVDPEFERVASRLTTLELRSDGEPEGSASAGLAGDLFGPVSGRFIDTYSMAGLRRALHDYGLDEQLRARGLGDVQLRISGDDPFHHRLEALLPEGSPGGEGDRHVMDLRLRLASVALPGVAEHAQVVMVDWLLMQNPRRSFTTNRPRLPGQRHPGTGLGRELSQLLILMCRRLGSDGLVTVPERFHLAELYRAGGWRAPDPAAERTLDSVLVSTPGLSLPVRAWAMERGYVTDDDGERVTYAPHEVVLPVSARLEAALAPGGFLWLARLLGPMPRVHVDLEGLATSLRREPVEGMDPDHLTR